MRPFAESEFIPPSSLHVFPSNFATYCLPLLFVNLPAAYILPTESLHKESIFRFAAKEFSPPSSLQIFPSNFAT